MTTANLAILATMSPGRDIFKKNLNRESWLIIFSNLIPVFGGAFLGWTATEIFIVYAMETLIVGILTVIKLLIAAFFKKKDAWYNNNATTQVNGLFFIVFFVLHFGIFAAVQTSIFSEIAGISPPGKGALHFFFHWWEYITKDTGYMLAGFVVSYIGREFIPYLLKKDYQTYPMMLLMFQPYGRIFIQQFAVITGSMFLVFKLGFVFILVFALAKIFVEVFLKFDDILKKTMASLKEKSGKQ